MRDYYQFKNQPDVSDISVQVKRSIATAKITEFQYQSYQLRKYVLSNVLSRRNASDLLYEAALSNGLIRTHDVDLIQLIIASGLNYRATT